MRLMCFVQSDRSVPPTPELGAAVGKLAEREMKAGRLIDSGGLLPLAKGAKVRLQDGKVSVLDGPFAESKEVVGGYAIFELPSLDEAIALSVELMNLHKNLCPGWEGTVEIRPFEQ